MSTLVLSEALARQIEAEGLAAYPNECCGILIGRDVVEGTETRRVIERLVPMKNAFDPAEQYHRFTIDPLAQMRAEREADAEGRQLVGFYHSHPDHPARPSEYDRQHMPPLSFYSQIIVAVAQGRVVDLACWILDEATEQFRPQALARGG